MEKLGCDGTTNVALKCFFCGTLKIHHLLSSDRAEMGVFVCFP